MDPPKKTSAWSPLGRTSFDPLPEPPPEATPTNHTIDEGENPALSHSNEVTGREGESQKALHHFPHLSPHEAAIPKVEHFEDQIESEAQLPPLIEGLPSSKVEPSEREREGREGEGYHETREVGGGGGEYDNISTKIAAEEGGGGRGGQVREEECELVMIDTVAEEHSDSSEYEDVATAIKEVFTREMVERDAVEDWRGGQKGVEEEEEEEEEEGVDGGERVKEEVRSAEEEEGIKLKLLPEDGVRGINSSEPTSPPILPPSFSPTMPHTLPPSPPPTLPSSLLDNQPPIPETTAAPWSPPEKINSGSPCKSVGSSTSLPRGPILSPEMGEEQLQDATSEAHPKPKVKPKPVPLPKPKRMKMLSNIDKMGKRESGGGSEEVGGRGEGGGREKAVLFEERNTSSKGTPTQGFAMATEDGSKVAAMRTASTSPPPVYTARKLSPDQTSLSCDKTATSRDQTGVSHDKTQPLPNVTTHALPLTTANTLQQAPSEYVPKLPEIRAKVEKRKREAEAKKQWLGVGTTDASGGTREVEEGTQLAKEAQYSHLSLLPAAGTKVSVSMKSNTQAVVGGESSKEVQSSGDHERTQTSGAATVDRKPMPTPDAELYSNCARRPPEILMRSRPTTSQQIPDKPFIPLPTNPHLVPPFAAASVPQQPPEGVSIHQPHPSPFLPLSPPSPALSSSSVPPFFPHGCLTNDKAIITKSHASHRQLPFAHQPHPLVGNSTPSSKTEALSPPPLPVHTKESLELPSDPSSSHSPLSSPSMRKKKGLKKFKAYDTMIGKFRKSNSEEKKKAKQMSKETSPEKEPSRRNKLKKAHSDAASQQTTIKNPRNISPRHAPSELKDRNTNATAKPPPPSSTAQPLPPSSTLQPPPPSSTLQPPPPSSTTQVPSPSLTQQIPRQTFLNMQIRPLPRAPYQVDDEEGIFHTLEDYEIVPSGLCPPLETRGGVHVLDVSQSLPAHLFHSSQMSSHPLHEEKLELPQDDGDYVNENEFLLPNYRSPQAVLQPLPAIGSRNPPSSSAFAADVREVVPKKRQDSSSGLPDYDYPDRHIFGLAALPAKLPPSMAAHSTGVASKPQKEVQKMSIQQRRQGTNLPPRHLARQMSHGAQSADESDDYVHMSPKATDDNYVNWETLNGRRKHPPSSSSSASTFRRHSLEDLRTYVNISTTKMSVPVRNEKSGPLRPSHPRVIALPPRHILRKEIQAVSVTQKPVDPQLLEPRKSVTHPIVLPSISPRPKPRKPPIQAAPTTRAPTTQSLSPSHTNLTQPPEGNISTSMIPSPIPSPRLLPKHVTQMPPQVLSKESSSADENNQSNKYYNVLSKDMYSPPSKKLNSNSNSSYPLAGNLRGKDNYLELLP